MSLNNVEPKTEGDPCVMVIFGATGDLTKRKLIPALLNLAKEEVLSKQFAIIGVAGNDLTTETFRKTLGEEMPQFAPDPIDLKMWDWLKERIFFVKGDFADADTFKRLKQQIEDVDKNQNTGGNRFFYLAVAPVFLLRSSSSWAMLALPRKKETTGPALLSKNRLATILPRRYNSTLI